ncbi:MAG: GtrA family protein [Chloroflexi bacterium]|nr:MAG: GtrA family protein [Chloroflexota bacterium]
MAQCNLEEVPVASHLDQGVQEKPLAELRLPSYRPYPWAFLNRIFDIVDSMTNGRAGLLQRFAMFVLIGGCAALVNLIVFFLVYHVVGLPVDDRVHNVIASILSAELSILANFIPNDYFTFRHLNGHNRSWSARCLRFHITAIGGSVLTFMIQFGFTYVGHVVSIVGQAIALIIVLFYNFSFHHIFTYRHTKLEPASSRA